MIIVACRLRHSIHKKPSNLTFSRLISAIKCLLASNLFSCCPTIEFRTWVFEYIYNFEQSQISRCQVSSADGFVRGSIPRLDASETMHEAASSGFHPDAVGSCRDGGDMPGRQCQVPWLRLHGGLQVDSGAITADCHRGCW